MHVLRTQVEKLKPKIRNPRPPDHRERQLAATSREKALSLQMGTSANT